jgi:hypothetical protein
MLANSINFVFVLNLAVFLREDGGARLDESYSNLVWKILSPHRASKPQG